MTKKNVGMASALTEHMLQGNRVTVLEASLFFGISTLSRVLTKIKKKGFIIKKEQVTMAKVIRRINDQTKCSPPKNLPLKDIYMHEWWISK